MKSGSVSDYELSGVGARASLYQPRIHSGTMYHLFKRIEIMKLHEEFFSGVPVD